MPANAWKNQQEHTIIETDEREHRYRPGLHVRGARLQADRHHAETMSLERRRLLKAFGADVQLTPGEKGMSGAIARAEELLKPSPIHSCRNNSRTPPTRTSTGDTTAEEIWNDTDASRFLGFRSRHGGTITGVSEVIKKRKPSFKAIAVEPVNSPVISQKMQGRS